MFWVLFEMSWEGTSTEYSQHVLIMKMIWQFISLSILFKSYRDDGRVIIKESV